MMSLAQLIAILLGLSAPAADPYVACPAKVVTFESARLTYVEMNRGCNGCVDCKAAGR